jgi:hypothetical protein
MSTSDLPQRARMQFLVSLKALSREPVSATRLALVSG